ncbi:hypothetical protein CHH65_13820 [Shouchella clausii]|uniref:collagen-like protein n=1 Tax=Shouchella clausii TaxID=79880 RepID=UPI000BA6D7AA|nr:collagen-like protein [Shouchella clausii]PAF08661.1 hypothetical protein CHH65_13820 [Shouchella clausii]
MPESDKQLIYTRMFGSYAALPQFYDVDGNPVVISTDNPLPVSFSGFEGGSGSNMRFLFGETAPTNADGQPGDVYLNTSNGDFYQNQNTEWVKIGTLRGPAGKDGADGKDGVDGNDAVIEEHSIENKHLADKCVNSRTIGTGSVFLANLNSEVKAILDGLQAQIDELKPEETE